MHRTRRQFLADVGRGALIAGVGSALAADLGLADARAAEAPAALNFGKLEPLVCQMQETPPDKLLPRLVARLQEGGDLKELVAAAALANARAFGGEDYVGFHTMMALAPAWHMARELPQARQPLPVLKVLYRNSNRIQECGGRKKEVLKPVEPGALPEGKSVGAALIEAARRKDMAGADRTFAALARQSIDDAFNELLVAVEDAQEVHRVVLPYRAWALLPIVGRENAEAMLRQSVHYCVRNESPGYSAQFGEARAVLPRLIDQHKLAGRKPGNRTADDAWVAKLSETIFKGKPAEAAGAVAEALAEGFAPEAIGEAIALAANQLVLRDEGRPPNQASPGKPVGSVHGDGIGVHACDSANAWRNLARAAEPRHTVACLILAGFQACRDRSQRGGDFLKWEPYPRAEARAAIKTREAAALLRKAEEAIKANDQALACAAVAAYGEAGHPPRPVIDL
ncbi:MAG TPA: hypothetical protein VFA26_25160, partial [Gemmataceae bacterium]|nr:hypothetical protein [Gemmataceae bacterium]